eukprot:scaffold25490_cov30-Tisochrysis_lutea.AAC.2
MSRATHRPKQMRRECRASRCRRRRQVERVRHHSTGQSSLASRPLAAATMLPRAGLPRPQVRRVGPPRHPSHVARASEPSGPRATRPTQRVPPTLHAEPGLPTRGLPRSDTQAIWEACPGSPWKSQRYRRHGGLCHPPPQVRREWRRRMLPARDPSAHPLAAQRPMHYRLATPRCQSVGARGMCAVP